MLANPARKEEKIALSITVISLWLIVMQYYTLIRYIPIYLKDNDADYEGIANMMRNAVILSYLGEITRVILFCILLYKAWRLLEGRTARTTAAAALGFLFIPFYNIYWVFVSFLGWVTDTNKLLQQYEQEKRLSKAAPTIFIISIFLSFFAAFFMIGENIYVTITPGARASSLTTWIYQPITTVYHIGYLMFSNLLAHGIMRIRSLV